MAAVQRVQVFISYAAADTAALEELKMGLSLLERRGDIRVWDDSQLLAGEPGERSIREKISTSSLFVFLASPDSLASNKCRRELQEAHQRASSSLRMIPLIVRPCDWRLAFGDEISPLPTDGRPVTTWANRDEAWLQVLQGIQRVLVHMGADSKAEVSRLKPGHQQRLANDIASRRTLLPHQTQSMLSGRSDPAEHGSITTPGVPSVTDLVGQRVGAIFATNQPALGRFRAAARLAVEAEHEGSEEGARIKCRLAASELLDSIEITLLWRFDRMRMMSATHEAAWSMTQSGEDVNSASWVFNQCVNTSEDPSLELLGLWVHGPSRLQPHDLLVAVRAALGIPRGLEQDVHLAGRLQFVFANWAQWRRKHRDLSQLMTSCNNMVGAYASGNKVEFDVPNTTVVWLEWLGKCLLDRVARPRP